MKKMANEMTKEELLDLIDYIVYQKSRRANDQLFKGLIKFINQLIEDNRLILEELDQIKRMLHTREENEVVKQKTDETEEDENSSFSKMQSKLKPEDLEKISKVAKNLKLNTELPTLKPHLPTFQIPDIKGKYE